MISAVVITLTITIKTITEGQLNRRYEFYYELNTLVSLLVYIVTVYMQMGLNTIINLYLGTICL